MLTESTLFFRNLTWDSRAESHPFSRLQNWRVKVNGLKSSISPSGSQLDSVTTPTQPPPSTIFSKSQVSHASSGTSVGENHCLPKGLPVDDLVGAFGDDDSDVDDSHERDVAMSTKGKVSRAQVSISSQSLCLVLIMISSKSTTVNISTLEDPDLVPPPPTQKRVSLKRNIEELHEISEDDSLLTPYDETSRDALDLDDTDIMQVDEHGFELEVEPAQATVAAACAPVKEEKAHRTTASVRLCRTISPTNYEFQYRHRSPLVLAASRLEMHPPRKQNLRRTLN